MLDYDPDAETLKMAESHSHPAEIWQLASCPAGDPRTLLSVYSEGTSSIPSSIIRYSFCHIDRAQCCRGADRRTTGVLTWNVSEVLVQQV